MKESDLKNGFRGAVDTNSNTDGVDAYMNECRALALAADPHNSELTEEMLTQATVSLAVQRIGEWANRNRDRCRDRDSIPSQTIVGVLSAAGIAATMFGYDIEDVIAKGKVVMRKARHDIEEMAKNAPEMFEAGRPRGPWDA